MYTDNRNWESKVCKSLSPPSSWSLYISFICIHYYYIIHYFYLYTLLLPLYIYICKILCKSLSLPLIMTGSHTIAPSGNFQRSDNQLRRRRLTVGWCVSELHFFILKKCNFETHYCWMVSSQHCPVFPCNLDPTDRAGCPLGVFVSWLCNEPDLN